MILLFLSLLSSKDNAVTMIISSFSFLKKFLKISKDWSIKLIENLLFRSKKPIQFGEELNAPKLN